MHSLHKEHRLCIDQLSQRSCCLLSKGNFEQIQLVMTLQIMKALEDKPYHPPVNIKQGGDNTQQRFDEQNYGWMV